MYRKVPTDLMEGTRRGSVLSLVAVGVMLGLFLMETSAYFRPRIVTDLTLDRNQEKRIRVNFNITMLDLKCEYTVVDVVSVLGTEQNVSSHITKWHVDAAGVRQRYQGRNKDQRDIAMFDPSVEESIEQLLHDGEDAVSLDAETFEYARKTYRYLFVDMYASWCSHCRDLAPTWEVLAELMGDVAEDIMDSKGKHDYSPEEYQHAKKLQQPVMIAKIDCVVHQQFCMDQQIMAYPTLRLFVDGERWKGGDYRSSRTLVDMADWLQQVEDTHKAEIGSEENRTAALALKGTLTDALRT
jgi:thiol-disulfide isomerase/thioredoxin